MSTKSPPQTKKNIYFPTCYDVWRWKIFCFFLNFFFVPPSSFLLKIGSTWCTLRISWQNFSLPSFHYKVLFSTRIHRFVDCILGKRIICINYFFGRGETTERITWGEDYHLYQPKTSNTLEFIMWILDGWNKYQESRRKCEYRKCPNFETFY